jgi:hypothetical protein
MTMPPASSAPPAAKPIVAIVPLLRASLNGPGSHWLLASQLALLFEDMAFSPKMEPTATPATPTPAMTNPTVLSPLPPLA